MLDITKILTDEFLKRLSEGYRTAFGSDQKALDYESQIIDAATQVIKLIASSNTLYHNVEHTIQVTLVGQAVLLGKQQAGEVLTKEDWLNCLLALLCHDIGYVSDTTLHNTVDAESRHGQDGKSVVWGKGVGVQVEYGG